jgi:LysM repeat protein
MAIGENPKKYGFHEPQSEKYPNLEAVEVPCPVKLQDIAHVFQIPLSELLWVNPNLQKDITPPHLSTYEIWLPEEKTKNTSQFYDQLAKLRITRHIATPPIASITPKNYHTVHPGETLTLIARKYKLTPSYLRKLNQLTSNHLEAGMKLRVTTQKYHPRNFSSYRVRRGDNLKNIAKKFGVSIQELKAENALRRNKIVSGQILRIRIRGT